MAIEVSLSNSTNKNIIVNYRIENSPVREVHIQNRAINNKVFFASEAELEAFRDAAKGFFDAGILIEGKAIEKQIVHNNEKLAKEANEGATKNDKAIEKLQEAADNVNAELVFEAEKVEKAKKEKKRSWKI